MNPDTNSTTSIPALLKDLRDETTTLLRQEVALAKAELKENTTQAASHAVKLVTGGLVAYAGVIVLLISLGHLLGAWLIRAGLTQPLAEWAAPTAVGLLVAIIGYAMLSRAKHALAHNDIVPRQTMESLRTTKQWAQNKLQPS